MYVVVVHGRQRNGAATAARVGRRHGGVSGLMWFAVEQRRGGVVRRLSVGGQRRDEQAAVKRWSSRRRRREVVASEVRCGGFAVE